MEATSTQSRLIGGFVDRLRAGDETARAELLNAACERLERMTRKMKRDYPALLRWEQTEDVSQNAALRLYQALAAVEVHDARHFFRLAAVQIRRELIDLARHYHGPHGIAANHFTQGAACENRSQAAPAYDRAEVTQDPQRIAEWAEMHTQIEGLPDEDREVFDLLWYSQLEQEEAADILQISVRQVKRRWRDAKLRLHEQLGGAFPEL